MWSFIVIGLIWEDKINKLLMNWITGRYKLFYRSLYDAPETYSETITMMTSSNKNIFRVTGHLCGEFTGHRNSPHKGQWRSALMFSLICAWINGWVNNGKAGDFRHHRAQYNVIVLQRKCIPDYGVIWDDNAWIAGDHVVGINFNKLVWLGIKRVCIAKWIKFKHGNNFYLTNKMNIVQTVLLP